MPGVHSVRADQAPVQRGPWLQAHPWVAHPGVVRAWTGTPPVRLSLRLQHQLSGRSYRRATARSARCVRPARRSERSCTPRRSKPAARALNWSSQGRSPEPLSKVAASLGVSSTIVGALHGRGAADRSLRLHFGLLPLGSDAPCGARRRTFRLSPTKMGSSQEWITSTKIIGAGGLFVVRARAGVSGCAPTAFRMLPEMGSASRDRETTRELVRPQRASRFGRRYCGLFSGLA